MTLLPPHEAETRPATFRERLGAVGMTWTALRHGSGLSIPKAVWLTVWLVLRG